MLDTTTAYNNVSLDDILFYIKLNETMTKKEIYDKYYSKKYKYSLDTFRKYMSIWNEKINNDTELLHSANLAYQFKPYKSTVQIDKEGNVIQAWIKQNKNEDEYYEMLLRAINENVQPINYDINLEDLIDNRLLEIPLFDMHFGLCDYKYYEQTRNRLIAIIKKHKWDEIHLIVGQDLFHNDDFEGRTTKGTLIEKVNMQQAWNDAKQFYYDIIMCSLTYCKNIHIHYSKGNHDKSISWTFVQLLKAMFPNLNYDDSLKPRKCIHWNGCFIGFGHCENKKSKPIDLFKQFVLEYPNEYANSTIREIHSGHLHHETGEDEGLMIRRLPTGNKIDEWNEEEGHVGAHKRFMVFEYEPNFLSAINYV
jgi:hypothetical protein